MKNYVMFVCETCGYESKDFDDMEKHEAAHLGLTQEELHSYNAMRSLVFHLHDLVETVHDDKVRTAYDKAIEDLTDFKKAHNIQ